MKHGYNTVNVKERLSVEAVLSEARLGPSSNLKTKIFKIIEERMRARGTRTGNGERKVLVLSHAPSFILC